MELDRNSLGISGVMVAVLLTIIGIVAVLMFWGVIAPLITPSQVSLTASKVSLIQTDNTVIAELTVTNTGNVKLSGFTLEIIGPGLSTFQSIGSKTVPSEIEAGRSASMIFQGTGISLQSGSTYQLILTAEDPAGNKHSFTFTVTARVLK